jgi:hypothetical protein
MPKATRIQGIYKPDVTQSVRNIMAQLPSCKGSGRWLEFLTGSSGTVGRAQTSRGRRNGRRISLGRRGYVKATVSILLLIILLGIFTAMSSFGSIARECH